MSYFSDAVLALAPKAYWRLNDVVSAGAQATDSSVNAQHGTIQLASTTITSVPGLIIGDLANNAMAKAAGGVFDRIDTPDTATLNLTGQALSLLFLCKGTAPGGFGTIIRKVNGNNGYAIRSTGAAAGVHLDIGNGSSLVGVDLLDATLWDGNSHIALVTWDGATARLYRDSSGMVASGALVATMTSAVGRVGKLFNDEGVGSTNIVATLDELAIFAATLTATNFANLNAAFLQVGALAVTVPWLNNSSIDLRQDGRWFDEKSETVQWFAGRKCSCTAEFDVSRANPNCLVCSGIGTFYASPIYIIAALSAASNTKILMDFGVALPGDIIMSLRPMDDVLIADRDQIKFTWQTGESYEGELAKRSATSLSDKLIYDALSLDAVTQSDADLGTVASFVENTDYTHSSQSDTLTWIAGKGPAQGSTYSVRYRPRFSYLCFTPPAERRERGTGLGQRVLLRRKHIALAKG